MSREQNVPLLLWISAALLAHIATGGGAERLAQVLDDRASLHAFANSVRARLKGEDETIEIDLVDTDSLEAPQQTPPDQETPAEQRKLAEQKEPEKEPEPEKPAPKPPEPKQAKTEPTEKTPTPPAPPQQDRRIAVRQHAKPDQKDNPNANYIADEANWVEQETVAEITSRDQDDPNPTPGAEHAGPSEQPGNADEDRVAQSEDRAGDPDKAPSSDPTPPKPVEQPKTAKAEPPPSPPKAAQEPRASKPAEPTQGPKPETASASAEPRSPTDAPEVASAETGGFRLDPRRSGGEAKKPDVPKTEPRLGLGLGATGRTDSGINLNLTQQGVVAAVGEDTLSRERRADGERRRSTHRGSFQPSQFERWRAAIENYVSAVKPGNQTALNAARVPFATYLNTIHNRIHPIFADDFLVSLDSLPANHPLNDPKLMTRLEIVLDPEEGRVVRMGVLRTSGVTAFDIAALDSVQRASPFGKPPSVIVSKDGNVYFHWEFHRNPMYACSTMNARPYMLTTPPSNPEPKKPAPIIVPGGDPREQGIPTPPASREGSLAPSKPKRS